MMLSSFPDENSVTLSLAGMTIKIYSHDFNIQTIMNPLYQLFLNETMEHFDYLLQIVYQNDLKQAGAQADRYPRAHFHQDEIQLFFTNSQLFYHLTDRSATLLTSEIIPVLDLEYTLRVLSAYFVLQLGGLLLHAAGIARNGKGYVFCGPSGVGKSTVARLSQDAMILNDDLTILSPAVKRSWSAFATPFANPGQKIVNMSAPLQAIYLLKQSTTVQVEKMSLGMAMAELISNVPVLAGDIYRSDQLVSISQEILRNIPFFILSFEKNPIFWNIISN